MQGRLTARGPAVESFSGKLAVVTGGGSGMGRELVRLRAAAGCSVAACDWHPAAVEQAAASARAGAAVVTAVSAHACDVSDEAQVERFGDELLAAHARDHVDLVFCNAGIGGGASFVRDSREEWECTFAVDWQGVYYCARVFLPLLIKSGDGVLVNTSSVGGFWATGGPGMPNAGAAHRRLPGQGAAVRGRRGGRHPRRGAVRRVADTRRPGRHPDRCGGARQARSRLRLRRAVQRGTASAGPGARRGLMRPR
jgi:NAD(P)-dependent dehydrogenase (short-subunit alcohol dehydrogenase family)